MTPDEAKREAERWLDELKPSKGKTPEGVTREHYYGGLAMLETLGYKFEQLENGQHLVIEGPEHGNV